MGYPPISKFDKLVLERTLYNLENYNGNYDFTFLLSQCLSLLILPNEFYKKGRKLRYDFLRTNVNKINALDGIISNKTINIYLESEGQISREKSIFFSYKGNIKDAESILLSELINKIRNGIAHWGITPIEENNKWSGVIIKNYNGRINTMDIYLSEEDLKKLCVYIAKKWIQCIS